MADKIIEHIEKNDSLDKGRVKINNALGGFQTQIDTLVVEGDSSVEAAQARVDAGGYTYDTLKQRLDAADANAEGKASQEDVEELIKDKAEKTDIQDLKKEVDEKVNIDDLEELIPDVEFKGALLLLNNNIPMDHNAWTTVAWGKAEYNYSGFWSSSSPSRIIIPEGVKKVKLTGNTLWVANNDGRRTIRMRKNGQYTAGLPYISVLGGGTFPLNVSSAVVETQPGDYFEMEVRQASGEELELREDPYTYFSLEVVEYSKK